ncbi:class I SAM-dependent methyltransferase [Shewanella sp. VB17]|uniref:SAM-dependent methyltransferase n=1 Tax=Shewanella sp. VB17 TaxID=2739432 RepID=UPI0015668B5D|nr:cyclopropane-fatty-acyl-phospholipid synthase family protein [Shewanella sp. VB17]NRD74259.1 class I SAM-dependent methyltransferase [Shewanella sp. VB17]
MESTQKEISLVKTSWLNDKYRLLVHKLLSRLEGGHIELEEAGNRMSFGDIHANLTCKIVVLDEHFYTSLIQDGSIGGAESYIAHHWTCSNLTALIQIMARNQSQLDELDNKTQWLSRIKHQFLRLKNANTEQGSKKNILAHYDIGNDLYQSFLDPEMLYSCAIYNDKAWDLDAAQLNKMEQICQKLALKPEDHLLEIGTGWGGLAIHAVRHYGCKVTTTTISDEQYAYTKNRVEALGLSDQVTLLKSDYRLLEGQYSKLVSIEMIEAVGHEYLGGFFRICSNLLKPDGKMLIQAITIADQRYDKYRSGVDFIQKYIFPGGCLPSVSVMASHLSEQTDMVLDRLDDIGVHYARTLHHWRERFEAQWLMLSSLGYSESFRRLWLFYFAYCEGAFIERVISTHHLVARKPAYLGEQHEAILAY